MASQHVMLYILIVLTGIYFLAQLVVSHISHSLTLLIDAYHSLHNIMILAGCIIAIKMSNSVKLKNTFGWARVEVLGLLISLLTLGALCFSVLVEAIQTMVHHSHSDAMHYPLLVIGIESTGLVLNIISGIFIGGFMNAQERTVSVYSDTVEVSIKVPQEVTFGKNQNLCSGNEDKGEDSETGTRRTTKSMVMDFVRNVTCSFLAIICACLVYFCDETTALFADPLLSIVSVFALAASTYPIVTESGLILLQTVPSYIDIKTLKKSFMDAFPAILDVHDFHVWRLTRCKTIATTHVIFTSPNAYKDVANQIDKFFHNQGILLTTVQPEFLRCNEGQTNNADCILQCKEHDCQLRMCCSNSKPQAVISHISTNTSHCFHTHVHHESTLQLTEGKLQHSEKATQECGTDPYEEVESVTRM